MFSTEPFKKQLCNGSDRLLRPDLLGCLGFGEPLSAQWVEAALYCLYRRRKHDGETQIKKEIQQQAP